VVGRCQHIQIQNQKKGQLDKGYETLYYLAESKFKIADFLRQPDREKIPAVVEEGG